MGSIVLCSRFPREFQESRRFLNDSSCGLRFPRAPKGPSVLTDTLSLTSSGMCILDNIEQVSILILCFIASSVSIWAQALWIFFAPHPPAPAQKGGGVRRPKFPWAPFLCCLRFKLENFLKGRNCYDMDQISRSSSSALRSRLCWTASSEALLFCWRLRPHNLVNSGCTGSRDPTLGSMDPTKSCGAWPPFLSLNTQWVTLSFVQ